MPSCACRSIWNRRIPRHASVDAWARKRTSRTRVRGHWVTGRGCGCFSPMKPAWLPAQFHAGGDAVRVEGRLIDIDAGPSKGVGGTPCPEIRQLGQIDGAIDVVARPEHPVPKEERITNVQG